MKLFMCMLYFMFDLKIVLINLTEYTPKIRKYDFPIIYKQRDIKIFKNKVVL